MRVADVRTKLLTGPWRGDPFWLDDFVRTTALVEVEAEDGTVGLGETMLGYLAPEVVPPIVDYYAQLLVGSDLDPLQPEVAFRELYQLSLGWARVGAGLSVLSAVEMALWDLAGKVREQPVYELLGGAVHDEVAIYASGATAKWPLENAVQQAAAYVGMGFRAVKLGTGYDARPNGGLYAATEAERAAEEHQKLAALRTHLGNDVELAIDSHAQQVREPWSLSTALAIARAVEEFEPLFYEEPLRYDDPWGYQRLRSQTRVPIAGGEGLTGVGDFEVFLRCESLDYVQPDAAHVGGISACRQVASRAEAAHAQLLVHTGASVGPGLMANIHVSFASPNARMVEFVLAPANIRDELLIEPIQLKAGTIRPPSAPGLGVELSTATIARYPFVRGAIEYC